MRLHVDLRWNRSPLHFDYQHELVRTLHKWLPDNDIHNDISLYSVSWLFGGRRGVDGKLHFEHDAKWQISFHDESIAKHLLVGILRQTETTFGMRVTDVQIQETPEFGHSHRFLALSPILAKLPDGKNSIHKIYSDSEADAILTSTLQKKLTMAGFSNDVRVRFDKTYPKAQTKLVTIKKIKNRASICPVIVEGNPEAVSFAWSVGIGHCTGAGFGAIA